MTKIVTILFFLGSLLAPNLTAADSFALSDEDEAEGTEAVQDDDEPTLDVNVGGYISYNVLFRDYGAGTAFEDGADRALSDGGFTFDTFRINADGSFGDLTFSTEYAIYPDAFGGLFIHHGWVGYEFSDARQIQVGVTQSPFGIQPFASSSWFFNNNYYVGLEDQYNAGIKAILQPGNWDLQGAYFMNPAGTDFFGTTTADRYSYDVIPSNDPLRNTIQEHQANAKVAYSFDHGDLGFTKLGFSGQVGQLTNQGNNLPDTQDPAAGDTDSHAAYAVHAQGRYGGFEAKLQFMQQTMNPPVAETENEDFVIMGAYGGTYEVASDIDVASTSVGYHIPVDIGPISQFKPYYDYSQVFKDVDGWNDNVSHIIGFTTAAGPLFMYTDFIVSKGHPFNQPFDGTFGSVMAEQADNEWRTAFNINIGIYF